MQLNPVTESDILSMLAKHKTPPDSHIDLLVHPDMRHVLYDTLGIDEADRNEDSWVSGVYEGAQAGVWSAWTVPTPYGLLSCVYTLEAPPGVIQYLARNKSTQDVVDEIDLRPEGATCE